jgi:AAA+ ATPase superfamily predicted ATPase
MTLWQSCGLQKKPWVLCLDEFPYLVARDASESGRDTVALAESLFFDFAPYMEQEPRRILHDEGLNGANALAVLEAVGRGASRVSEIASRLGTAQTNLSRLLQQLMDASVLSRDLPYGESSRTSKRTLYQIQDPALRFWFSVHSPHRSLWRTYPAAKKDLLIHGHAATVFEDWCRGLYPGAGRYWEKNLQIDVVCPDPDAPHRLLVGEAKWTLLRKTQRETVLRELKDKWNRCALASRHPDVRFEVFDVKRIH